MGRGSAGAGAMLVRVTFGRLGNLGWEPGLRLGTGVGRTVARNQPVVRDGRSPDNPAGLRLKDILMARVDVEREGRRLLAGMSCTTPGIDPVQTMGSRGHPEGLDVHPRIYGLGVERQEAHRWGEDHERIRLRLAGLVG